MPKLSSSIMLEDHTLWFGKMILHEDKIVISGWDWTGPVEESIPLAKINRFEKWTVSEGPNFRLHRENGRPLFGRIEKGIGFWEREIKADDRVELKNRH